MGEEEKIETQFCSNCQKDIPSINYVMHVSHCSRNIILCKLCEEPVPISEKDEHFEEYHAKVKCECGKSLEKMDLESHKEKECANRQVICLYCELELPFSEMAEHKDFCGSRTQLCEKCHKYIQYKDLEDHLNSNCQEKQKSRKNNNALQHGSQRSRTYPDDIIHNFDYGNTTDLAPQRTRPNHDEPVYNVDYGSVSDLEAEALQRILLASQGDISQGEIITRDTDRNRDLYDPINMFPQPSRDVIARGPSKHSKSRRNRNNDELFRNEASKRSQMDGDELMAALLACEDNESVGYMALNSECDMHPIGNLLHSAEAGNGNEEVESALDETVLPCEFCGEAIPAQQLILHQSGCQLTSTTTENSSPSVEYPNLRSQPWTLPPIQFQSFNDDFDQFASQASHDDTLLPCEFCDVLIHPDYLFSHQSICDPQRTRPSSVIHRDNFYDNNTEPSLPNNTRASNRPPRPSRPVVNNGLDSSSLENILLNNEYTSSSSTASGSARKKTGNELRRDSSPPETDTFEMDNRHRESPLTAVKRCPRKSSPKNEVYRRSFPGLSTEQKTDRYRGLVSSKAGSMEKLPRSTIKESRSTTLYSGAAPTRDDQERISISKTSRYRGVASGQEFIKSLDSQQTNSASNYRATEVERHVKNKASSAKKYAGTSSKRTDIAPAFDVKPLPSTYSRREALGKVSMSRNGSSERLGAGSSVRDKESKTRKSSKKKYA